MVFFVVRKTAEGTGVEPATPVKGHLISSEAASHSLTLRDGEKLSPSGKPIVSEKPTSGKFPFEFFERIEIWANISNRKHREDTM